LVFEQVRNYFGKEPKVVLIDADPVLLSACQFVCPTAVKKVYSWHTETNIKNVSLV